MKPKNVREVLRQEILPKFHGVWHGESGIPNEYGNFNTSVLLEFPTKEDAYNFFTEFHEFMSPKMSFEE